MTAQLIGSAQRMMEAGTIADLFAAWLLERLSDAFTVETNGDGRYKVRITRDEKAELLLSGDRMRFMKRVYLRRTRHQARRESFRKKCFMSRGIPDKADWPQWLEAIKNQLTIHEPAITGKKGKAQP